jgi:hypothetical protein
MRRGSWLGLVSLALVASMAVAEDGDAEITETWPRWGVGWLSQSSAPTFRVRLGAWNVGLAAKPDDNLSYVESWGETSWGDAVPDSLRDVPTDHKREAGWIRVDVARTLKRWESVELPLMLAFAYSWRDEEWRTRYWQAEDQAYRSEVRQQYTNGYELILALRPSWRIRPWLSVETEFGIRYTWSNDDYSQRVSRPEWEEDRTEYRQGETKSFRSHGYYSSAGIGMLSLILWL